MYNLHQAQITAKDIYIKLASYCDRIHIAGSIRREKSVVKDIEIVCQPKREPERVSTLFETHDPKFVILPIFKNELAKLGTVNKGNVEGRYMQLMVKHFYGVINLDLFMPQEVDYYRMLCIRTGSREYVQNHIAIGWRKLGWVGTDDGLRRYDECININEGKLDRDQVRMKPKFVCQLDNPTKPPHWKSEADFFDWLEIPFVEPKYRIA